MSSIEPDIFDGLYGAGAQKTWLTTAASLTKRQKELLEHPDEAATLQGEVAKYLKQPGLVGHLSSYFGHRLLFDALILGGGYESGHIGTALGALFGIEGYEMLAHSQPAMKLLQKAATEKDAKVAARLIISALNAAIRTGAESATGGK